MIGEVESMIKMIHSFDNIDGRKLMALYRESNEENIAFFYPKCKTRAKRWQKWKQII